jgi:hypothetical protein
MPDGGLAARPRLLIEDWLPAAAIGVECMRERGAANAVVPTTFLHVWGASAPRGKPGRGTRKCSAGGFPARRIRAAVGFRPARRRTCRNPSTYGYRRPCRGRVRRAARI